MLTKVSCEGDYSFYLNSGMALEGEKTHKQESYIKKLYPDSKVVRGTTSNDCYFKHMDNGFFLTPIRDQEVTNDCADDVDAYTSYLNNGNAIH